MTVRLEVKLLSSVPVTQLDHLEECAQRSSDYTAEVAATAVSALRSMDAAKLDKPSNVSASLPASGWTLDANDTSGYPYYYDLAAAGVTANDIAHVNINYTSQKAALECGLCASNNTLAGIIRFYAARQPSSQISINYWILKF